MLCDDNAGSRAQGNTNFTELFGVKCHIGGADMDATLWIKIFISRQCWSGPILKVMLKSVLRVLPSN